MKAFGLDYETLRRVNPKLITSSTRLMGQTAAIDVRGRWQPGRRNCGLLRDHRLA